MARETYDRLAAGDTPKGDVLALARVAGIMAAKRTPELIPLCHPVATTSVSVDVRLEEAIARAQHPGDRGGRGPHGSGDGGHGRGKPRGPHRLRHAKGDRSRRGD